MTEPSRAATASRPPAPWACWRRCAAACRSPRSCWSAGSSRSLLAVVASIGRVLVPIAVQQTVDTGILADGGPDVSRVAALAGARRDRAA